MKLSDWPERALGAAVTVLLAALALSWAWAVLLPLLPLVLVVGAAIVAARTALNRRRYW